MKPACHHSELFCESRRIHSQACSIILYRFLPLLPWPVTGLLCTSTLMLCAWSIKHLSCASNMPKPHVPLLQGTTSTAWMPSLARGESELTLFFAFMLQIQAVMVDVLCQKWFRVSVL